MHNIKSITQKDRYGNMFSLEMFEDQGVPLMIMIPDMPDGYNGADTDNHPGNPKGTDTVPAWLTPGENVVNAEASRIPGNQEKIDAMNEEGRKIQEMQGGPIPTYASTGNQIQAYGGEDYEPYDVPEWFTPEILEKLIQVESGNNNQAVNQKTGATGAAQIMADTALDPGYNVQPITLEERKDPDKARNFATQYIAGIQKENPNYTPSQVLQAYNAGPGRLAQAMSGKGAPLAQETIDYPKKILGEDFVPPKPASATSQRDASNRKFNIKAVTNNLKNVQEKFDDFEKRRLENLSRGRDEFKGINKKTYDLTKSSVDKLQSELDSLQVEDKKESPVNTIDFVNNIIAETDTGDTPDQPPPDNKIGVTEAGLNQRENNPGFFKEATGLFLDVLGDMFPPKELARMVIEYTGSRALGYEHNGSLNYAMKGYADRYTAETKRNLELVKANKDSYSTESYNEFIKTGDVNVLEPKKVGITQTSGSTYIRGLGIVPTVKLSDKSEAVLINGKPVKVSQVINNQGTTLADIMEPVDKDVHSVQAVRNRLDKVAEDARSAANVDIGLDEGKGLSDDTQAIAMEAASKFNKILLRNGASIAQSEDLEIAVNGAIQDYYTARAIAKRDGTTLPKSVEGYVEARLITPLTNNSISMDMIQGTSVQNLRSLNKRIYNDMDVKDKRDPKFQEEYADEWAATKAAWAALSADQRAEWTRKAAKRDDYSAFTLWMSKTSAKEIDNLIEQSTK